MTSNIAARLASRNNGRVYEGYVGKLMTPVLGVAFDKDSYKEFKKTRANAYANKAYKAKKINDIVVIY
jgi:hypothetical protein